MTVSNPRITATHIQAAPRAASAPPVLLAVLAAAGAVAFGVAGCDGDDATTDETTAAESFACTADKAGWEQCTDNMVQWCHAEAGMEPHFHWGANCQDLGQSCVELSGTEAACVDTSSSCSAGEHRCEKETAYNCLADGHWAVEPCIGTTICHEAAAGAICQDECASFDPQLACDALATTPESKQVAAIFSEVLDEAYHAELDTAVQVTLPDGAASYIHFPVTQSGRYLVFLDTADVLGTILGADETDMTPAGGGPNDACPDDLLDRYYADLIYDGSGGAPVPFVIRFNAGPSRTVTFVIVRQCGLSE